MKLWEYPNINDVTTTPDDAPVFKKLARKDPDVFKQRVKPLFGDALEPQTFEEDPDELFLRVEKAAQDLDWRLERVDRESRTLEAVDITPKLRFRDDVIVVVTEESVVHVRSRSRLGRKDFGANETRIRKFQKRLEQG